MPDPDHDAEPERRTDPRYDHWPVERYDAYSNLPVERGTPREEGGTREELAEEYLEERDDYEWVGFAGTGGNDAQPYVYDPQGSAVYAGEVDDLNERVVLREASERAVDDEESLGEHIEEIGEEHDWQWLSSFAREYLEDEDHAEAVSGDRTVLELDESTFQERAVPADSAADAAFQGSHTMRDGSGQVYVLDRRFEVETDASGRATVDVDEDYLVAEEPRSESRAGDAERVADREHSFRVEFDSDAPNPEARVEERLREWHERHVGWSETE
jgi:hypothetical protein